MAVSLFFSDVGFPSFFETFLFDFWVLFHGVDYVIYWVAHICVFVGKVDKPSFLMELKSIVKELDIEKQVYFFEETREIIPFYQAAKIFVAPSFSEGFSLVTAEAMACECTVIATKNVGVHDDLISHEKNSYLFEAGKSDGLATILQNLISGEIPFLGKEARLEILKNWSAEKEATELIKIYQSN